MHEEDGEYIGQKNKDGNFFTFYVHIYLLRFLKEYKKENNTPFCMKTKLLNEHFFFSKSRIWWLLLAMEVIYSFKSIDLEHLSTQMLLAGALVIKAAMVKLQNML